MKEIPKKGLAGAFEESFQGNVVMHGCSIQRDVTLSIKIGIQMTPVPQPLASFAQEEPMVMKEASRIEGEAGNHVYLFKRLFVRRETLYAAK